MTDICTIRAVGEAIYEAEPLLLLVNGAGADTASNLSLRVSGSHTLARG